MAADCQKSDQRIHKLISDYRDTSFLAGYADERYAYGLSFRRSVVEQEGAIQKSFTEHYEIYKALEQGNPKLAEKAMLDHLNSVYYTTISAMRN